MRANNSRCIGVTLMARIIGAYSMSISILLLNVLMSDFFSRKADDFDFFESVKTWAILGFNWVQAIEHTHLQKKAQTAMICFLIYIVTFLIASACLALGSFSRRHKCALPWMFLQIVSIIDQYVAICIYIIQIYSDQKHLTASDRNMTRIIGYVTMYGMYLFLSIYFWIVVYEARRKWYNDQQDHVDYESNDPPLPTSTNSSGLKSPSFISQNFLMFESPRPPVTQPK